MMHLRNILWVVALSSLACGLGPFAEQGGGDDRLPQSGAGPYVFAAADFDTSADEPYVLAQPIVSLTDPWVHILDDGRYEIFYTRSTEVESEVWRVRLESLDALPAEAPERVLAPSADWEGSVVRAPSLVVRGSEFFLYYEGGDDAPSIGLARSTDGGQTFVKDVSNPVITEAGDPDVIATEDSWLMVYIDPLGEQVLLREGQSAAVFGAPRSLVSARLGAGTFDSLGIQSPALRRQTSAAGREHFGLFYAGLGPNADGEETSSIGYQGSFDLQQWTAFLEGEPILAAGPAGAGGPAPVLDGTDSLLFVHQARQGRGRLAVAFGP